MLLEGYKPWDIHNTDEIGIIYNCLRDRILILKGQSFHRQISAKERIKMLLCVNSDGGNKELLNLYGKSLQLHCFKNMKTPP
jgi:hypothetical protein